MESFLNLKTPKMQKIYVFTANELSKLTCDELHRYIEILSFRLDINYVTYNCLCNIEICMLIKIIFKIIIYTCTAYIPDY